MPTLRITIGQGPGTGDYAETDGSRDIRVGHSQACELPVEGAGLDVRQFRIRSDNDSFLLVDLSRSGTTLVNGQRVREAILRAGDEIEAGDVRFRVEIELGGPQPSVAAADTPPQPSASNTPTASVPPADAPPAYPTPILTEVEPHDFDTLMSGPESLPQATALTSLMPTGDDYQLYAAIDGAQAFDLAVFAKAAGNPVFTLFTGEKAQELAGIGPCAVILEKPDPFLRRWTEAAGGHAGVLLVSAAPRESVLEHLREIFVVTDEEDQEFFFRYYDPRVFRTFLPTCRPEELKEFFGPVDAWIVETEDGREFRTWRHPSNKS